MFAPKVLLCFLLAVRNEKKEGSLAKKFFFLAKFPVAVVDVPLSGQERVEYPMS